MNKQQAEKRLQQAVSLLKNNPNMTDSQLVSRMGLGSLDSARFWRREACKVLGWSVPEVSEDVKQKELESADRDVLLEENPAAAVAYGMAEGMRQAHGRLQARDAEKRERRAGFFRKIAGLFNAGDDDDSTGVPARPAPSGPRSPARFVNAETYEDDPDVFQGEKLTAEDIMKRRRMERIERARVGRPFHERVMLFFLKGWLLIGPIAFVALTAAEVAYILTHLVAHDDQNGEVIIWGGALFIEFAMMFTTFGLGIKRHEAAEYREIYGKADPTLERLVLIGTVLWIVFALINIVGQTSFLMSLVQSSQDPNMQVLYLFVASRVVGFILGDAGTAFFLGQVDSNDVRLMARAEHEKGKLYMELSEAEGKRKLLEAEADSKVKSMAIKVEQERADAEFLAMLKEQTFTRILELQRGAPGGQALPSPSADLPITGEFQTLSAEGQAPEQERVRIRRLDK